MTITPMIVYKTVQENGVAVLQLMNVEFVMAIILLAQTNVEYLGAIILLAQMNVEYRGEITPLAQTVRILRMVQPKLMNVEFVQVVALAMKLTQT